KFETIITRGATTSRMRDFYDIYILTTVCTYDSGVYEAALEKTVEKRGTIGQMEDIVGVIRMIADNSIMIELWQRYQKKYPYAAEVSWNMTIGALERLAQNNPFQQNK
ncbi:MAG: nucleotidyl transferase AbiEii/AbiGii toxin family protein, partial [Oscillospiraceae bacterium]|nr:nucleotidyl transferase AbiEii/AbiGii toxin family protein [Oscillospiraceae bacterium]